MHLVGDKNIRLSNFPRFFCHFLHSSQSRYPQLFFKDLWSTVSLPNPPKTLRNQSWNGKNTPAWCLSPPFGLGPRTRAPGTSKPLLRRVCSPRQRRLWSGQWLSRKHLDLWRPRQQWPPILLSWIYLLWTNSAWRILLSYLYVITPSKCECKDLIMSTTAEDCGPLLSAGATCANPSWNLYVDAFIWCCTPDDVGLALGDGECLTTALTYSNYASTVCYTSFHLECFP
jgi:hypothetical protein